MVVTAIAMAVAAVALVVSLRSSLIDEVDRSIDSRAIDVLEQTDTFNDVIALGVGADERTFAVVLDSVGDVFASTDDSVGADELLDKIGTFDTPYDLSLPLAYTDGSNNLRAVAMHLDYEPLTDATNARETGAEDYVVLVATSLDGVDQTVRRITIGAAIAAPLLVILVGLLTWLMAGRALRPVETMRREVDEISSTDLDRRVEHPPADDEIGRLAGTMNSMLRRLEQSQKVQTQFVSDASHELRSPLASMAARLDVAERHGTDDPNQLVRELQGDTDRMRRLVDDLLLLARSDAKSAEVTPEASRGLVDLDDIVLAAAATIVNPRNINLDTSAVSAGLVNGNADQLTRVVVNLADNAVRHATSRVAITLSEQNDSVQLTVDDDGAGIPADQRDSIFDRFVRLDEARSRDAGGSGLGLAITAEIVQAHGGTVHVAESSLGGARFTIKLPTPT